MRLIDADRLRFVEACIEPTFVWDKPHWETIILKDRIDNAPTVDAIPVIRCKDCKYAVNEPYKGEDVYICERTMWSRPEGKRDANGFCAWAERREKEIVKCNECKYYNGKYRICDMDRVATGARCMKAERK